MKAAIYNPYLDSLGGGERYTMAVASYLLKSGYKVDLEWSDISIKEKLESRFGINIADLSIVNSIKRGDGYDLCFWVSDGSVPTLFARKNLLHFQVPFHDVSGSSLLNKMKFFRISKIICNSEFTKKVIDNEYGVKSVVLYPPVDIVSIRPKRKVNTILSVGRFSQVGRSKRQDVLIEAFKEFSKSNPDWKLVLAGAADVGVGSYLDELKELAGDSNIEILANPDFKTLVQLYGTSKLFWFASGYGVDAENSPEKVEHFGIVVVEAMASGAVPIVFDAGGHKEIVKDSENGFLWKTPEELVTKSELLIKDNSLRVKLADQAVKDAGNFSYEQFEKSLSEIL